MNRETTDSEYLIAHKTAEEYRVKAMRCRERFRSTSSLDSSLTS